MISPQERIVRELSNNNGKRFALVVDDRPIMLDGRQVYVKVEQSRLSTLIYMRQSNGKAISEISVDIPRIWEYLENNREFFGIDFSPVYDVRGTEYRVFVNELFNVLFIENPAVTFIKNIAEHAADNGIRTLNVSLDSPEFWNKIKNNWGYIYSEFQISAVMNYNRILNVVLKRRLNRKMFWERNRLFGEKINKNSINFIYLFLRTTGLYNPFLEKSGGLATSAKDTWFFNTTNNNRLFPRTGPGYTLYCMTVNDFCKSIGLETKLGFTSETAIMFLFGMLYGGPVKSINIPTEGMNGYMVSYANPETGKLIRAELLDAEPGENMTPYERTCRKINGLEAFAIKYATTLGGGVKDWYAVRNLLKDAYFERRS